MPYLPFQIAGSEFLAANRVALLADEMRVGKTYQAIRAFDLTGAKPTFILCPPVAVTNWALKIAELSIFSPDITAIYTGRDMPSPDGVTICPYSLVSKPGIQTRAADIKYTNVIADEAHYLKSKDSLRTRAVYGGGGFQSLIKRASHYWALSGTPMPNYPNELWPLLRVFGVTRLSYDAFLAKYCVTRWYRGSQRVIGAKNTAELKALLAPYVLRRKRADVMREQPAIISKFYVDGFNDEVAKLAEPIAAAMRAGATNEDKLAALAAETGSGATLRRITALIKAPAVAEMVKDRLEAGQSNVVVFGISREALKLICDKTSEYSPVLVNGGTSAKNRAEYVRAFQNKESRVFIGNMVSAGEAVDLSVASNIIALELDWTPKTNEQAFARCSGLNQTKQVEIEVVTMAGSIDDDINSALMSKISGIAEVFG